MKHLALAILALVSAACSSPAGSAGAFELPAATEPYDPSHARLDALLDAYVVGDAVDYAALQGQREELDLYLANLAQLDHATFAALPRAERHAFWINVYNASILRLIVEHYPVDSIRDLGGSVFGRVWDQRLIPLGHLAPELGEANLSFTDVEHAILRPRFEDARVHAAINCASISCPPLLERAFVAESLEADLDEVMRAFVNDPTRNTLDDAADELELSAIFDWFAEDFEADAGSVRAYVERYANGAETAWILDAGLAYREYDWGLNDVDEER